MPGHNSSTPKVKKSRGLTAYAGAVYLHPPRDEDLLFYIHHMILIMGSRLDQMNDKR